MKKLFLIEEKEMLYIKRLLINIELLSEQVQKTENEGTIENYIKGIQAATNKIQHMLSNEE